MHFLMILLPVFGIFVTGFIGQKILKFDIAGLSKMSLYILSPFSGFQNVLQPSAYFCLCLLRFLCIDFVYRADCAGVSVV